MNDVASSNAVSAAPARNPEQRQDGVRETVESIVVALILAFVFRAFIVEAFVIPTGSMAPTLYGAHGTVLCEDCGWEYAYGLQDPSEAPRSDRVEAGSTATCPNCAHRQTNLFYNDSAQNAETGDRILVLKWPLDLGIPALGPKRWDVTVFKNPSDGQQNYIKRLTGMPNEVLMIVDGDVYAVGTGEVSPEAIQELRQLRHVKYLIQAGRMPGHMPEPTALLMDELESKLRITRKTPQAQRSLWFPVHHQNYTPKTLDGDQPRWLSPSAANARWTVEPRRVRFAGDDDTADFIEFSRKSILAGYAYNIRSQQPPAATDQRIHFVVTPRRDGGTLAVRLTKHGRTFWAMLQMDGQVALVESKDFPVAGAPEMANRTLAPFAAGKPVAVSFENLDYRLSLKIGPQEVLSSSSDPNSPAYYAPNVKAIRKIPFVQSVPPRIYGRQTEFEITHLVLERDVHYYEAQLPNPPYSGTNAFSGMRGWGTSGNPILLGEGEYFMLGDNSPASQDSRLWGDIVKNAYLTARGEAYQLGTVPQDQLIGKAFFVYWPSAHRIPWLPLPARWGVVPDVGRMRWIR